MKAPRRIRRRLITTRPTCRRSRRGCWIGKPIIARISIHWGVIFFQLLTGRLPFPETDFSRLIHAHLAKKPPSLQRLRPSVPPPLADVVQKLLAKNAAERYQSARALMADLNRCRREWRRAGQIRRFPLGRHDIPAIMQLPLKLYGREKELELLQRSYQAVKREGTGFVFVSGFAGSGKTTLVNQFLSSLAGRGRLLHRRQMRPVSTRPALCFICASPPRAAPPGVERR